MHDGNSDYKFEGSKCGLCKSTHLEVVISNCRNDCVNVMLKKKL